MRKTNVVLTSTSTIGIPIDRIPGCTWEMLNEFISDEKFKLVVGNGLLCVMVPKNIDENLNTTILDKMGREPIYKIKAISIGDNDVYVTIYNESLLAYESTFDILHARYKENAITLIPTITDGKIAHIEFIRTKAVTDDERYSIVKIDLDKFDTPIDAFKKLYTNRRVDIDIYASTLYPQYKIENHTSDFVVYAVKKVRIDGDGFMYLYMDDYELSPNTRKIFPPIGWLCALTSKPLFGIQYTVTKNDPCGATVNDLDVGTYGLTDEIVKTWKKFCLE